MEDLKLSRSDKNRLELIEQAHQRKMPICCETEKEAKKVKALTEKIGIEIKVAYIAPFKIVEV